MNLRYKRKMHGYIFRNINFLFGIAEFHTTLLLKY